MRVIGEHVAVRPRAALADLVEELREELLWADSEDGDLNTVFGWSYRSLRLDDAALFRRLALHPGLRISLDAATVLAGSDRRETDRALNRLARASLIDHDTARHYRMHDLLRQFAGTRGEAVDQAAATAAAQVRITTWFLRSATNAAALLAPQLPPVPHLPPTPPHVMEFAGEADALEWCQAERDNLGAAARYAAQHGLHRLAWQIPAAINEIFTRTGRYDDLIGLNQLAAESARIDGHVHGEVASLGNLGYALCATHRYDRAIDPLTRAYDRAPETGDPAVRPVCAHNLGTAFLNLGDVRRAVGLFREARDGSRRIGDEHGESATLHQLGEAHRREGRPELALAAYREALELREKVGWIRGQGLTHRQLGVLHLAAGRLTEAAEHCAAALTMHELAHDEAGHCDALTTMADTERTMGVETAVSRARSAVAACAELGDSYRKLHALAVLADALAGTDRLDDAARTCSQALEIASELPGPDAKPLLTRVLATWGAIANAAHDTPAY